MPCSSPPNRCQLLALRLVANRDERLERRLVVEELVLVDLVRPDGRLDGALQLHPRDVAVVVVVRQERLGTLGEERLQRRLGRELRRLAQQSGRLSELVLIFDAVRNERELAVGRAADDGEEPGGAGALRLRKRP